MPGIFTVDERIGTRWPRPQMPELVSVTSKAECKQSIICDKCDLLKFVYFTADVQDVLL